MSKYLVEKGASSRGAYYETLFRRAYKVRCSRLTSRLIFLQLTSNNTPEIEVLRTVMRVNLVTTTETAEDLAKRRRPAELPFNQLYIKLSNTMSINLDNKVCKDSKLTSHDDHW